MTVVFVTHSTHNQTRVLILGNLPFVEPMRKATDVQKNHENLFMYTIINMNKYDFRSSN